MPASIPVAPSLLTPAFRVGVTGARSIKADQAERVQAQLAQVLKLIWHEVKSHCNTPRASAVYRDSVIDPPLLRLISPLARGADRMAVEAALNLTADYSPFAISVPMPFPLEVYVSDFGGTTADEAGERPMTAEEDRQQFHRLLSHAAERVELDGEHHFAVNSPLNPSESYEAVGRFVARHSDVLIGVWDGTCGKGRGGSAEIIRYAASIGVPVWWIHAEQDQPPVWLFAVVTRVELTNSAGELLGTLSGSSLPQP